MPKMTPQEWLNKAAWEGGIFMGLDYGLRADHLDASDPHFNELVRAVENAFQPYQDSESNLLDYAEDQGYEVGQ